jgi:hypothetical protein
MYRNTLFTLLALAVLGATRGFSVSPRTAHRYDTSLNLFGDMLKGAFGNDDSLGARKNEGLAGGPNYNEAVTVNGKAVQGAVVGQKLTVVAGRARVKIPVNCQKGEIDPLALTFERLYVPANKCSFSKRRLRHLCGEYEWETGQGMPNPAT